MSDIALRAHWEQLRQQRRVGLIPFLSAGYPSRAATLEALAMVTAAGADLVELGIPFSDPLADGPVIQRSSQVALDGGMTVSGALGLVREAGLEIPVIAFSYLNPILSYGLERFLEDAATAGVAGLLLTDLPAAEDQTIERTVRESALALIPLVAPTTEEARMVLALDGAQGFVYVISRLGVTGPRTTIDAVVENTVRRVRRATRLPVAVGFGITGGDQAATAARYADGVVVGSALISLLGKDIGAARDLMNELRSALDGARQPSRAG